MKGENKTITTEKELEKAIKDEKDMILSDENLVKSFEKIDKMLVKNKDTKEFREYLEMNDKILPELKNLQRFKQRLWVAYLAKNKSIYNELVNEYKGGKKEIEKIIYAAKEENTKWKYVLKTFNERFLVPFKVVMENQEDVILRSEAPSIKFKFNDTAKEDGVDIDESTLWNILSNGEKRALYILNIIFEVEARKEANQETLFIIDDIADSFDYKNKYAIVEYLNDIAKEKLFYQLILTHNYDFFRTINSRLDIERENKLHTIKSQDDIKIIEEKYQNNPFRHWKNSLCSNNEMLIASIPFLRNLAEFCGHDESYDTLTKLLHMKSDTKNISIGDLCNTIKNILKDKANITLCDCNNKVIDVIYKESDKIFNDSNQIMELEKKIVLSIAIRLKIEDKMIKSIQDNVFVNGIKRNQTVSLINKLKSAKNPKHKKLIDLSERVNLMTPENIHINSFMYEPLIDMSCEHLKQLYGEVESYK